MKRGSFLVFCSLFVRPGGGCEPASNMLESSQLCVCACVRACDENKT